MTASVSGLVPNALYHVRLVATNSAGTTFGPDVTFTTARAATARLAGARQDVQRLARQRRGAGQGQRRVRSADRAHADPEEHGDRRPPRHAHTDQRRRESARRPATRPRRARSTRRPRPRRARSAARSSRSARHQGAGKGLVTLAIVEGAAFKGRPQLRHLQGQAQGRRRQRPPPPRARLSSYCTPAPTASSAPRAATAPPPSSAPNGRSPTAATAPSPTTSPTPCRSTTSSTTRRSSPRRTELPGQSTQSRDEVPLRKSRLAGPSALSSGSPPRSRLRSYHRSRRPRFRARCAQLASPNSCIGRVPPTGARPPAPPVSTRLTTWPSAPTARTST